MTQSTLPADPGPTRRSRVRRFLPGLILLGGVLGAFFLVANRPQPNRMPAPRSLPMVSTEAIAPRTASLMVEGTGNVRPTAEVELSSEVSGRVVEVSPQLVRGGSFAQGDTLLLIDSRRYRNAVAIARAEVQQREVDVALAAQNQQVAQEEFELFRTRTGAEARADTALAVRLARQQPQYEAAEASLARAEAQLADAILDLQRTVVTAPFSGRVRSESVDVGQVLSTGQTFAQIYGTDAVEVDVSLSTSDAALIDGLWDDSSARIPATVRAEYGGTWYEWDGVVEHASGALDQTTRTVEIVVRVPNPFDTQEGRPPLLIGSYVRASIAGRQIEDHYAIPRTALRDGSSLWVVEESGTLTSTPVRVLQEIQDTVFVRANLADGARVVVSDLAVMTEGMEVRLDGDDATASRMAQATRDRNITPRRDGSAVPAVSTGGGGGS